MSPGEASGGSVRVEPLHGIPAIAPGDDLGALLGDAIEQLGGLADGDVVVVAQKVVSKAEGRLAEARTPAAREALIRGEARHIRRRRGELFIVETRQGFVCATAGIDHSNTAEEGTAILLPRDPDKSARELSAALGSRFELGDPPVVISDSFGRAWRAGTVDIAIGVAGFAPLVDLRGSLDWSGRELESTQVAVADELAAAAHLVMGKSAGVPAAIVRGATIERRAGLATELVMPADRDLFP